MKQLVALGLFIYIRNCLFVQGAVVGSCKSSQFLCSSGQCVPRIWVCDGDEDCKDGSDEANCWEKPCSGFLCTDGGCVGNGSLCDGSSDCQDGSDELQENCGQTECKQDEFTCKSRHCVSLDSRCNGRDDCGDGSDEESCHSCMDDYFLCPRSGGCLLRAQVCDGSPDCPDGADERHGLCQLPQQTHHGCPEFSCSDGQCVPHSWRCDHAQDCVDGSDEQDCDQNECLDSNGGCSHLCIDQPLGFVCDCLHGMRLVRDTQCEEIDECLDTDLCGQLCFNENGTFTCDCHSGYLKGAKAGECRAGGDKPLLAFSSADGVWRMDAAGLESRKLVGGDLGSAPLAVFTANRTLYWAESKTASIYMISLDESSGKPHLVLSDLGEVMGLAVDWLHSLLYWTDALVGSVNVAPLNGDRRRLLIGGLSTPTGIAVEPLLGLLFWAETGGFARIERAGMDGEDRLTVVGSGLHNPIAISLDTPRRLLYWADSTLRTISRVGFDGKHRKTVLESNGHLDRPFALAVFEGKVFWGDQETRTLCSADKHNGSSFKVLLSDIRSLGGLVAVHPLLQPEAASGAGVCGHPGKVCPFQCVPRLFDTNPPHFFCLVPGDDVAEGHKKSAVLYDATFAEILSLIVLLSVLLAVLVLWWWNTEFSCPRSRLLHPTISLKESQDPLVPVLVPDMYSFKDAQLKVEERCHMSI
nr:low-density lipoprotein receptor-related protein 8-like [Paramormyrops kingsleyae]